MIPPQMQQPPKKPIWPYFVVGFFVICCGCTGLGALVNSFMPKTATTAENTSKPETKPARKSVTLGDMNGVEYFATLADIDSKLGSTKAKGKFYSIVVGCHNGSSKPLNMTKGDLKLVDSNDKEYPPSPEGLAGLKDAGQFTELTGEPIPEGTTKAISTTFDGPDGLTDLKILVPNSFNGDDVLLKVMSAKEFKTFSQTFIK